MIKIFFRFLQHAGLKFILVLFLLGQVHFDLRSQDLPLGYISYFSDKCNSPGFLKSWNTDRQENWDIIKLKEGNVLRGKSSDSLVFSYVPETRGILSNLIFGDFILEFEFKLSSQQHSDSSGFYFLGPIKSSQDYYALAFTHDSLRFYFIDDSVTKKIAVKPVELNEGGWNKVRIRRDILSRRLNITINNNPEEIAFSDRKLVMGYIGFGTHDVSSYLKNINVWAPTSIVDTTFFW